MAESEEVRDSSHICAGCNFTYWEAIGKFFDNSDSINFFRSHGVLLQKINCAKCNLPCNFRTDRSCCECNRQTINKNKTKGLQGVISVFQITPVRSSLMSISCLGKFSFLQIFGCRKGSHTLSSSRIWGRVPKLQ